MKTKIARLLLFSLLLSSLCALSACMSISHRIPPYTNPPQNHEPIYLQTKAPTAGESEPSDISSAEPTDIPSFSEKDSGEPTEEPTQPLPSLGKDEFSRDGNYVWFGQYPQSVKADSVTLAATPDANGRYLGSDGAYYIKSTAIPYADYHFANGSPIITGEAYYFKIEPIRWRILEEKDGIAFLLADSVLVNPRFDAESNHYAESEVREWLNAVFYDAAFTLSQKSHVLITRVDNSAKSFGETDSPYACADTDDRIFLLSYAEAVNPQYGFARNSFGEGDTAKSLITSDYMRAGGVSIAAYDEAHYGNGWWWLRSPHYNMSTDAYILDGEGRFNYCHVKMSEAGVAPAMRMTLPTKEPPADQPTTAPTSAPTTAPTSAPTTAPTSAPTTAPTSAPTTAPTTAPTSAPTTAPTSAPTTAPTSAPTTAPTSAPTTAPTSAPTTAPTSAPTTAPTSAPTTAPTSAPTEEPTAEETSAVTFPTVPTGAPTEPVALPSGVDYQRYGDYIHFGEYPQTLKPESVTLTDTIDSRGCYLGSDGRYYAKVTADPFEDHYTYANGTSILEGEDVYFRMEPLRWRILEEKDGELFLVCDRIITNFPFSSYTNHYENSEIRSWLNNAFYQIAFTESQKEHILTTKVDNSAASTGDSENPFACADTYDNVFLLSYAEVTNPAYGFTSDYGITDALPDPAKRMPVTDFARAIGAWMDTVPEHGVYGCGAWWLRSPHASLESSVCCIYDAVYSNGVKNVLEYEVAESTCMGVVPALRIVLD